VTDIVVKRAKLGKHYGTILVPEGVIEFFPEIGSLIHEINDILADAEESDTEHVDAKAVVSEKLSEEALKTFQFLPKVIQE